VPEVNFSIDIPVAVVDKNVDKHGTREVAEAFVQYLFTPEAQAEFVKLGFRPLAASADKNKEVAAQYPPVKTLGTIKEFGGWTEAQDKYFGDKGIFDEIRDAR
jgi:sulfate transport system substrate-binding protein